MNYKQILKAAFPDLPEKAVVFETTKPGARMRAFSTLVRDEQKVRIVVVEGVPLEAVESWCNGALRQVAIRGVGKRDAEILRKYSHTQKLDVQPEAELSDEELEAATAPEA